MKKVLIIIAGIPATGKTTYGNKISKELKIPIFSKDRFKEVIYDSVCDSSFGYEQKRKVGISSYSVLYAICEEMMKIGASFIIESNFTKDSAVRINELLEKYSYKGIVVKFDADLKTLHTRFLEREQTAERHPGLVANGVFDDFEKFKEISQKARDFKLEKNEEILVDTTDFSQVNFEEILRKIENRCQNESGNTKNS